MWKLRMSTVSHGCSSGTQYTPPGALKNHGMRKLRCPRPPPRFGRLVALQDIMKKLGQTDLRTVLHGHALTAEHAGCKHRCLGF